MSNVAVSTKTYTTTEAAHEVRITRATLQDWIKNGKFAAPKLQRLGKVSARLWTASDVARLEKKRAEIYQEKRKGKKSKV